MSRLHAKLCRAFLFYEYAKSVQAIIIIIIVYYAKWQHRKKYNYIHKIRKYIHKTEHKNRLQAKITVRIQSVAVFAVMIINVVNRTRVVSFVSDDNNNLLIPLVVGIIAVVVVIIIIVVVVAVVVVLSRRRRRRHNSTPRSYTTLLYTL